MDANNADDIVRRFSEAHPVDRPWLIEGQGDMPARIRHVSATIGSGDGWLNVSWLPFGPTDAAAGGTLPKTFEDVEVRCHKERDTPLEPEELVFDEFGDTYMFAEAGTIEGDDGTPVRLCGLSLSSNSSADRTAKYGCPPGEIAILADWIPAGLTHVRKDPRKMPVEAGVDPAKVPAPGTWIVFPREFNGLRVYYKRGAQFFAL